MDVMAIFEMPSCKCQEGVDKPPLYTDPFNYYIHALEVLQPSLGAHYSYDASQQPATSPDPMDSEDDACPDKTEPAAPRRSRRAAAQEARDRMMAKALDEN